MRIKKKNKNPNTYWIPMVMVMCVKCINIYCLRFACVFRRFSAESVSLIKLLFHFSCWCSSTQWHNFEVPHMCAILSPNKCVCVSSLLCTCRFPRKDFLGGLGEWCRFGFCLNLESCNVHWCAALVCLTCFPYLSEGPVVTLQAGSHIEVPSAMCLQGPSLVCSL